MHTQLTIITHDVSLSFVNFAILHTVLVCGAARLAQASQSGSFFSLFSFFSLYIVSTFFSPNKHHVLFVSKIFDFGFLKSVFLGVGSGMCVPSCVCVCMRVYAVPWALITVP